MYILWETAWMALFHSLVTSHSVQSHLLSNMPEWRNLFISRHLQLCSWLDWEHMQWRFVECIVTVLSSLIQTVRTHIVTSENARLYSIMLNWLTPLPSPISSLFLVYKCCCACRLYYIYLFLLVLVFTYVTPSSSFKYHYSLMKSATVCCQSVWLILKWPAYHSQSVQCLYRTT